MYKRQVISIAVTAALLYLYHKVPGGKQYWLLHVCYTLILAGAAGNQIDRIFRGFVVDMFEFYWFRFPVFNPVSYTHLDVYKRQVSGYSTCP